MAIVPLAQAGSGLMTFKVPRGMLPTTVDRQAAVAGHEPPVPVVRSGEPSPSDRLLRFAAAFAGSRGVGIGATSLVVVQRVAPNI